MPLPDRFFNLIVIHLNNLLQPHLALEGTVGMVLIVA